MKKITYLKSLLIAALFMGANNVWAEKEKSTLLTIDYSTTTTPAWTVVGGTGTIADGAWTHAQAGGGGNRSAYLDFGLASSIEDNWTVEFDAKLKPGSDRNDQQITVAGANTTYSNNTSATGYMYFAVKEESNGGTTYTVKIGNTDVATGVTLANGTTYHFKVVYDGTSAVKAYIGETEYNGTVALADVGKLRGLHSCVARYNGAITYDNIVVSKEVEAGSVEVPTASITAVDSINRTLTFACATDGVSFSYSTDGVNFTDGNYVVISENTTIYVKATKGSASATSAGLFFEAGTAIALNAPTIAKTGYSNGAYTISIAHNQSNLAIVPSTTKLYYSIDGGASTEYSSPIILVCGATISAHVESEGYTNSSNTIMTAYSRPLFAEVWAIDFAGQATEDKGGVTVGNDDFTAGGIGFGRITAANYTSNDNFGVKTGSSWLLRNGNRGLYSFNGGSTPIGVANLTEGQYVIITGTSIQDYYISTTGVGEYISDYSIPNQLVLRANADGNMCIKLDRYAFIQSIAVCDLAATEIVGALDYSTGANAASSSDYTLKKGETKVFTFQNHGQDFGKNWRIVVKEGENWKSNTCADSWDYTAGAATKVAYTESKDGGSTKVALNWDEYRADMADARVVATLAYGLDGTLAITTTSTGAANGYIYYVDQDVTGLTDDLTINLSVNNSWLEILSVEQGATPVTLAASGYSTLATPYGLDFSSVEGLTAFVVSDISNTTVTLESVDEMPANSGVILKGTASTAYSIPTKGDAAFTGTNKLHAAVTAYDCAANEVYIMQGGQFHLVTAASTVPAGKAYLLASDVPSAAKELNFFFDEGTTAIEGVESRAALNGQFYNLAGQRVNVPTRGIYIVNGKKVYVK